MYVLNTVWIYLSKTFQFFVGIMSPKNFVTIDLTIAWSLKFGFPLSKNKDMPLNNFLNTKL